MTTKTKTAAEVRNSLKTTRADLKIEILPNIAFENKGEFAVLEYESTRIVPNDGEPFNVHDVIYVEGSLPHMTQGKDKTPADLKNGERVSLKGNARLDRGFAKMQKGQRVLVEYLGKVDAGNGRTANDYLFDIING